ncbi:MAG: type II toxin-antitoxin system death-on-curing family toxin [Terracidiphilus sp.]
MKEPVWIRLDAAQAMHDEALRLHGGPEGVRDLGLLESALDRPKNLFAYSRPLPSLAQLAAAYAYGVVANHPFADGNERAAFIISITFLRLNGVCLTAAKEDRVLTFWKLADGSLTQGQLAEWFDRSSAPCPAHPADRPVRVG